ncbi:ABC transporter permease [Thermogemmatispora sp.]|uniref:ABC transporter permease n=1 Tax=Thermogemmatispora sp. TaxID=1968838 RepID=UPI001D7D0F70|nr:ABC transporter permease [Thermogemmatispora sp.]MBX5448688.1 ABC transporter permease [Thermogemmatispora sp.]
MTMVTQATTAFSGEGGQRRQSYTAARHLRPRFWGLVYAELLKLSRQWTTWILLALLFCGNAGLYILEFSLGTIDSSILKDPLVYLYQQLRGLDILRVFSGMVLIVLAARCFGLEYQLGTIRVLLARGVGRLQLFWAKLLTLLLVSALVLLLGVLEVFVCSCLLILIKLGNLEVLKAAHATFWHDAGLAVLSVGCSMLLSVLMAVTLAVIGRSQAFGVSAAIGYFPADNFLVALLYFASRLTNNPFWQDASAYLLGPNLNVMASALTDFRFFSLGTFPLNLKLIDARHIWLLLFVYALVFLGISLVLTWKRDVKE